MRYKLYKLAKCEANNGKMKIKGNKSFVSPFSSGTFAIYAYSLRFQFFIIYAYGLIWYKSALTSWNNESER